MSRSKLCALLLVMAATPALGRAADALVRPKEEVVSFRLEENAGRRPRVHAGFNGKPLEMEIHANAGLYMQLQHAFAKQVGVKILRHAGAFGIESPGQVSKLGRDEGEIADFNVGSTHLPHRPVSVFETPGEKVGMLGLDWIRDNGIVMDYVKHQVVLNPSHETRQSLSKRMSKSGYVAIPMTENAKGRFVVPVTINDVTRAMTVGTVAGLILDSDFASAAHVEGKAGVSYGGPGGATGLEYITDKPIYMMIDTWQSGPVIGIHIHDEYEYMGWPRPASGPTGGTLGADFMIANGAVIDFGAKTLYLKKTIKH
ncbi:hypothetical protein [Xanthomonas maliensis]|uniref:hypothetical protein n=1 Tax=Xanthomonas maliensis TaxID=1321368 RepID=UPI00126512C3|nr:hypothetical protein [Xanthomonas maliensis]KAB7770043.1 hypothetical protein CKY51_04600 [Xanthomonas maliensis]